MYVRRGNTSPAPLWLSLSLRHQNPFRKHLLHQRRALDSGEILIEPEAEDEHDLLPETDEPRTLRESGELMLEQEIGLGPHGLRLASRLIDAGFGVTTTSEKWGGGGRHRQTSHEIDES